MSYLETHVINGEQRDEVYSKVQFSSWNVRNPVGQFGFEGLPRDLVAIIETGGWGCDCEAVGDWLPLGLFLFFSLSNSHWSKSAQGTFQTQIWQKRKREVHRFFIMTAMVELIVSDTWTQRPTKKLGVSRSMFIGRVGKDESDAFFMTRSK